MILAGTNRPPVAAPEKSEKPRFGISTAASSPAPTGAKKEASAADLAIDALLRSGAITKRPNVKGGFTWGSENKLAIHVASGIPVDFFATDEDRFWNSLFARTGPLALNKEIASLAPKMGWEWHAYGDGFNRGKREHTRVKSERDAVKFSLEKAAPPVSSGRSSNLSLPKMLFTARKKRRPAVGKPRPRAILA